MAKVRFRYIPFPLTPTEAHPNATVAYRPVAAATITASTGEQIRWLVLPDSGADGCMFPLSLARLLKLDVPKLAQEVTGGVGSQNNITYYDTLSIDLGNGIAFSVYAGFTEGMDAVGLGLIGQEGFFESFNVEFRRSEKIFTIEAI
jgi:hypothetical protein